MCAKTPMSAKKMGLAEPGRAGTAVPVSASESRTSKLGTHEEDARTATAVRSRDREPFAEARLVLGVHPTAHGLGRARRWPMCAKKKSVAETGRHGTEGSVRANPNMLAHMRRAKIECLGFGARRAARLEHRHRG
jgi:hypothetical protein